MSDWSNLPGCGPQACIAAIANPVPRVTGRIRRKFPVELRDVEFLRANTDRRIKITVPGPFTMAQQAQNDYYEDEQEMVLDYAAAVNAEIKDLFAAGADIVQIDEPYMQARPEKARKYACAGSKQRLMASMVPQQFISASAMPQSSICGRKAIHSCRSWLGRPCNRFPLRPRNPISTARCWKSCRERPSSSAPSIFPI